MFAVVAKGEAGHDELDRAAVEMIRGAPLPQVWPTGALAAGTRVHVVQDEAWAGPWAMVFTASVSDMAAPELVVSPVARPGELNYWVDFDESQMDAAGDGPYRRAQIWDRYIEVLEADQP